MTQLVYVAGPIDFAGDPRAPWRAARQWATDLLHREPGTIIYRPDQAWAVRIDPQDAAADLRLEAVNRAALGNADALIAFLPKDVVTYGTLREIEAAQQQGTPACVVTDVEWSFALADLPQFTLDSEGKGIEQAVEWALTQKTFYAPQIQAPLPFARISDDDLPDVLPSRGYSGDAGFDLVCSRDTWVPAGEFVDVPCGVRVAFPEGVWGRIVGRSSTLRRRHLMVSEGVIDGGYRGELFSGVWNLGQDDELVRAGERIAQLILQPNIASSFVPTWADIDQIPLIDQRGENGFGSSGR